MKLLKISWKVQKPTKKAKVCRNSRVFPLLVTSPWYHHGRFMIKTFFKMLQTWVSHWLCACGCVQRSSLGWKPLFPPKNAKMMAKTPKSEHFCLQNCLNFTRVPPQISALTVDAKSENKNVHVRISLFFLVLFKPKEKTCFSQSKWGPRTSWTHLTQSEGQSEIWKILWSQIWNFPKVRKN